MKKARILVLMGSVLFAASIYLDNFTLVPKYFASPLLPAGLILLFFGIREARRFPQTHKPLTGKRRHLIFASMLALIAIASIGSLYLSSRNNSNLSIRSDLIAFAVTLIFCGGIVYWRVYRRPIDTDLNRFPKRWLVLISIAAICFILSALFGFLDRDSEATRRVDQQIGAAVEASQKKPAGLERGDEFTRQLHAIDAHRAPADVQVALSEYIKVLDDAFDLYRKGQPATAAMMFDPVIAEKKRALTQAINNHK